MGVIEGILSMLFIYLVAKGLFRTFTLTQAKKKAQTLEAQKMQMEAEVEHKEVIEMVTDDICGRSVPKSQAYILVKGDKKYYFCSWDCREKFTAASQCNCSAD